MVGALTVTATYVAAAVTCIRAAGAAKPWRWFWWGHSIVLLALAADRLVGLHKWVSKLARQFARDEGLYKDRQRIQLVLLALIALTAITGAVACYRFRLRLSWPRTGALAGMVLIIAYALARAVSYHRLDVLGGRSVLAMRVSSLLEVFLVIPVIAAACAEYRRARREDQGPV